VPNEPLLYYFIVKLLNGFIAIATVYYL